MALRTDDISINTILGSGSFITGNLKVNGFVRIDGDIDGNLETDGNIIIGENARIRGNIKANSVTIGGVVIGDVNAIESVKLLSSSIVRGDVISHKVLIEDNAFCHGHCISLRNAENFTKISEEYLSAKAIKEKVTI